MDSYGALHDFLLTVKSAQAKPRIQQIHTMSPDEKQKLLEAFHPEHRVARLPWT
jgi:hypothetical protein